MFSRSKVLILIHLLTQIKGQRTDEVSVITTTNFGTEGTWRSWEYCAANTYVRGIKIKGDGDANYGIDTIELRCYSTAGGTTSGTYVGSIYSFMGSYGGSFNSEATCPSDNYWTPCSLTYFYVPFAKAFQVKVPNANVAVNGIMMKCFNDLSMEPPGGGGMGSYGSWAECPAGTAICGIQVKYDDVPDISAVNQINLSCCRICDLTAALYLSGNTCAYCHYTCKTCSGGGSNQCQSCYFTHSLTSGSCVLPTCKIIVIL